MVFYFFHKKRIKYSKFKENIFLCLVYRVDEILLNIYKKIM